MLALPIFCWLRWQPQAWFAEQLAENKLTGQLTYASVEKSFPGLALIKASIKLPSDKNITFDKLQLQPQFISLFSGNPALFFRAERDGITAQGAISVDAGKLRLSNSEIRADAKKLAIFDTRLQLLGLKGELQLGGNIVLRRSDGLPLSGDISATWKQAVSLLLPALQSGNIRANLVAKNTEKSTPIWEWHIESKPQSINGKGKLIVSGTHIENWLLRGNIHMQGSGKADGNVLSGTLGSTSICTLKKLSAALDVDMDDLA